MGRTVWKTNIKDGTGITLSKTLLNKGKRYTTKLGISLSTDYALFDENPENLEMLRKRGIKYDKNTKEFTITVLTDMDITIYNNKTGNVVYHGGSDNYNLISTRNQWELDRAILDILNDEIERVQDNLSIRNIDQDENKEVCFTLYKESIDDGRKNYIAFNQQKLGADYVFYVSDPDIKGKDLNKLYEEVMRSIVDRTFMINKIHDFLYTDFYKDHKEEIFDAIWSSIKIKNGKMYITISDVNKSLDEKINSKIPHDEYVELVLDEFLAYFLFDVITIDRISSILYREYEGEEE